MGTCPSDGALGSVCINIMTMNIHERSDRTQSHLGYRLNSATRKTISQCSLVKSLALVKKITTAPILDKDAHFLRVRVISVFRVCATTRTASLSLARIQGMTRH